MLFKHFIVRLSPLKRQLRLPAVQSSFSTDTPPAASNSEAESPETNEVTEHKFYDGFYASKLKMLRRISITSSILSVFGLPIVISMSSGDMSVAAKISIASTAVVASVGSTAILQAITHPYITSMSYLKGGKHEGDNAAGNYKLKAVRMSILGNPRPSEFSLNDMKEVRVTSHPYANFQIDGKYYYVRPDVIENELLREKISERCNKKANK